MPGSFSQGATPQEIVFTPTGSFGRGSSVNVVLRKGYASRDGYALQDDFGLRFITTLSPATVLFQVGDQLARVSSAQSGHPVAVTLQFGEGVPAKVSALETFRATSGDLLAAQVHDANGAYLDAPIDTAAMQSVATAEVANGGTYTVTQPDGVYLLIAADDNNRYGSMWLVVSRFGVILRQDDQKIVLAGEDLTTGDYDSHLRRHLLSTFATACSRSSPAPLRAPGNLPRPIPRRSTWRSRRAAAKRS